ncbi:MAG: cyclic nucleotide-binding domain-containing protein [Planctomycetes bacterium]|nr:cyclic nucleotide-binding domain-containing protein [Planctomycetota bacterium]
MAEHPLQYLTPEDRDRLADGAVRFVYEKDAVILPEGSRRECLYFVRRGRLRIHRLQMGQSAVIATRGPGELCGEMSFIENQEASASLISDGEVEVDVVDGAYVQSLIERDPGFAARFYRSLALALSRKLRQIGNV